MMLPALKEDRSDEDSLFGTKFKMSGDTMII